MFELTTTYSLWWMLPIVILSALLSAILYYRNNKDEFPVWINVLLFSIRFVVFVILSSFLLSPTLKSWKTEIEKPVVILAVDNSKSMILSGDTVENRKNNINVIERLIDGLGAKYQIDKFTFGEKIQENFKPDFSDKYSDLSQLLINVGQRYQYRNVGALIVMSDGIYNRGSNPIYSASYLRFPIFTIGVGDSSIHADLSINQVLYNKSVFLENTFPIEAKIMTINRKNTKLKVSLFHNSKLVDAQFIKVNSDKQLIRVLFNVKAKTSGLHSYKIVVQPFSGELNVLNNVKNINIDVIGDKKKVLLLYPSPNPDIAALVQIFDKSDEFELEEQMLSNFKKNIKDYNLIIFYQLPNSSISSINIVKKAKKEDIPFLMILGPQTNLKRFNLLGLGIDISAKRNSVFEVTPLINPDFSDFTISKILKEEMVDFPPLYSPFGKYKIANFVHPVIYQQLGTVRTNYPLIAVSEQNAYRQAFIFGEGLWKWRMMDFLNNKHHDEFDRFIMKLVRYVSLTKSYQKFDIQYKRRNSRIEPIEFYAKFLNDNYEKITDADIQLLIFNSNGEKFSFAFSNKDDGYFLNVGQFPQGIYKFVAMTNYHGKSFQYKGSFVVDAIQLEAINLQANFDFLRKISAKGGGDFYTQQQLDKLIRDIINKEDIVNIQKQYIQFKELISFPWIWGILVVLISIEWFLRKQMGSY